MDFSEFWSLNNEKKEERIKDGILLCVEQLEMVCVCVGGERETLTLCDVCEDRRKEYLEMVLK